MNQVIFKFSDWVLVEGTYTQTKTNMKEVHVAMEAEIGVMQLQGKECGETGTFAIQEHGTDIPKTQLRSLHSPCCPLGSGVDRAEGSQLFPTPENKPSLRTGDRKMDKLAQGQFTERPESCWEDFLTDFLLGYRVFIPQTPKFSSSQEFPRPSGM